MPADNLTRNHRPVWLRAEQVYEQYGIKRGTLYNLDAQGKIWSKEKKITGQKKSLRFWNVESIEEWFDEDEKSPPESTGGGESKEVELAE